MKRYSSTRRKRDKSNITSYTTTMYPSIPIENSDKFIVTKIGDRLDTLAHRYYGDITLWWVIAKANGIKGKIALDVGTDLRIPGKISTIIENFRKINLSG
jgi:nucleoid-associated protein YgaU